jgi:hypothetical protein
LISTTYQQNPFYFFSILLVIFAGGRKFSDVMMLFPVFSSNSRRAFLAIFPPFLPACAFSVIPLASSVSAI